MKTVLISSWLASVWLGELIAYLSGVADWELFGFAFTGSTVYMLIESQQTNAPKRTGFQRLLLIVIGMMISLIASVAPNPYKWDLRWIVGLAGLFGYTAANAGLNYIKKRGENPADVFKDLNDLTKP